MGPRDILRNTLGFSDFSIKAYIKDLSDEELRVVAVEGMHPIALQLGHLISVENQLRGLIGSNTSAPLPEGFSEAHDIKNPGDGSRYLGTADYIRLWDEQRAATLALLDELGDSDMADTRGGQLPQWAPTVGAAFNVIGLHAANHSGQFVAVRRKLQKPIAF